MSGWRATHGICPDPTTPHAAARHLWEEAGLRLVAWQRKFGYVPPNEMADWMDIFDSWSTSLPLFLRLYEEHLLKPRPVPGDYSDMEVEV